MQAWKVWWTFPFKMGPPFQGGKIPSFSAGSGKQLRPKAPIQAPGFRCKNCHWINLNKQLGLKTTKSRWFKPWPVQPRSLEVTNNHLKGSRFHHPKKVTNRRIARFFFNVFCCFFNTKRQLNLTASLRLWPWWKKVTSVKDYCIRSLSVNWFQPTVCLKVLGVGGINLNPFYKWG